ncbi:Uncharacterised protein [Mycobacterium tuberculosis]|nr:Uncharacterised protein [Mycobacterium tuberculosis]
MARCLPVCSILFMFNLPIQQVTEKLWRVKERMKSIQKCGGKNLNQKKLLT